MNLMFCKTNILKSLNDDNFNKKENLIIKKVLTCELVVFGFEDDKLEFLTERYYIFIEKLKILSQKSSVSFVIPFYIKNIYRDYFGGVYIKNGKIKNIFGECFTNQNIVLKIKNKKIAILFYYDLYSKIGKEISKKVDVVIGIDDEIFENLVFLENKFFNKLILVGKNMEIESKILLKNKKDKKIFENIMYKI